MAAELDVVDASRAQAYLLLATLLARPPSGAMLEAVSELRGDATPWGEALGRLAAAAAGSDAKAAEREFNRLFIGMNRGELVPYASFYRTGFLQDRPLVEIRADMARLGVARSAEVSEPEDHIAALLEIMGGQITGRFAAKAGPHEQQAFFERHLAPWAPRFFSDLQTASAARLYRPVGALGKLLLEIEQSAFALV